MIKNAKFSGYYFDMNLNIWGDFQICISVPLITWNASRRTQSNQHHNKNLKTEQPKKSLYSEILTQKRSNTVRRKSSKTNIQPNKQDIIQIFKSLSINNTKGKVPSRSNSSTKRNEKRSLKFHIKQLKQEVQYLNNNWSNKEYGND